MSKLLPCPFCGNLNIRRHNVEPSAFYCADCFAEGPVADNWPGAEAEWNRRADAAELTRLRSLNAELGRSRDMLEARVHVANSKIGELEGLLGLVRTFVIARHSASECAPIIWKLDSAIARANGGGTP